MKKHETIKVKFISFSVGSLKFARTVLDYGISILERNIDDRERLSRKKKKGPDRAKRIEIK